MKNRRVLIVEDEADSRELLQLGLTDLGYHCQTAEDGHQAIALLSEDWDALVLDIVLPGFDGLELVKAVRAGGLHCLCILVSSFADKDRAIAALNNGADYLLEKPFSIKTLDHLLQTLEPRTPQLGLRERVAGYGMLTEREQEFVFYVLKGLPNEQIARLAGIQLQSVKNALGRIYSKLGVASRTEMLLLFMEH
ncbi:MAG: response regulator transcription factor [Thermoanaerobaculia bacterium]|nr:response regulator transcription factor [Thermoanaerobaculia bacterium]